MAQSLRDDGMMSLETYRKKRDFTRTAEPPPRRGRRHNRPIFVIQKHHARRLHYDLRLEADGVLKSWAVPKEPSVDPAERRLAVHVEDHPLDYAGFSGVIPPGEYGAGKVEIWDRGEYDNVMAEKDRPLSVSESIEAGHLEVDLHGRKLKGRFALVRMDGRGRRGRRGRRDEKDNWLLIKMKDQHAREDGSADGKQPKRRGCKRAGGTGEVALTNLDKVMFPEAGITKEEVIEFYRKIAPRLLSHLRDRPVTLQRLPEGLKKGGPRFWQKNTPAHVPDWLPRVRLRTREGKSVDYALVNDERTLLYLVNQGTITFHVWMSRVDDLDRPDYVLFDLDPGQAEFADAVAVARALHEILKREKIQSVVKTSGKTGLHVLVPWRRVSDYDEARRWAGQIARRVTEAVPEIATTQRSRNKRGRKVYVDVMQNVRGHHAVPPYVLRAVPEATVSTPLRWDELKRALDPARFNLRTIFRRLSRQKRDPMKILL